MAYPLYDGDSTCTNKIEGKVLSTETESFKKSYDVQESNKNKKQNNNTHFFIIVIIPITSIYFD